MNKKQLIVTTVLLMLMFTLSVVQVFFNKSFKEAALISNGITCFKQYTFDEGKHFISLPLEWETYDKTESSKYSLYKMNFKDDCTSITGSVELIESVENLNSFSENDTSNQTLNYYDVQILPFENESNSGVISEYKTSIEDGYDFTNESYYVSVEDGKILKVIFNVKESSYRENLKSIFSAIIETAK
ncbi:hypothetical protein [Clostridium sp. BJN0001]|uniref:hypothetical protein n=1 Tax=Clostridium sp. BJN0001 TaxID=2930219 RepID=UPI001FD4E83D|nr:hypothetical protein [Clostridium sp. BJN0001]